MSKAPQSVFDAFSTTARRITAEVARELESTPRHLLPEGNPNHPMYDLQLFGEHYADFMQRQFAKPGSSRA